jgi:hypothetical protein
MSDEQMRENMRFRSKGRSASIEFHYPRHEDEINELEVGLLDVRAADSIKIKYDFKRDGYSIMQASIFCFDDQDLDEDWQEVAFVRAWARETVTPYHSEEEAKAIREFQAELAKEDNHHVRTRLLLR